MFRGLALEDPVETAPSAYSVSKEATTVLHESIFTGNPVKISDHTNHCQQVTRQASHSREEQRVSLSHQFLADLPKPEHKTLSRIVKGNAFGWLTVLPLQQEGYDLSATQF